MKPQKMPTEEELRQRWRKSHQGNSIIAMARGNNGSSTPLNDSVDPKKAVENARYLVFLLCNLLPQQR